MQFRVKDYDKSVHDCWMALTIPQPDADYLVTPVVMRKDGSLAACKYSIDLDFSTDYRGDILICSGASKHPQTHPPGQMRGLVHLDSIETTEDGLYRWVFSDPRRVVEFPISGRAGLWKYICPKGEVTEYPRLIRL